VIEPACTVLAETARAKVNLSLRILGKRADGYHELDSLVAFAGVGDTVTLTVGSPVTVTVHGPFSRAIVGENLAQRALNLAQATCPSLRVGGVTIDKQLPVAAGLGGGSADAAAVLRLVRRANPQLAAQVDWSAIAEALGSDVPACLLNRTCRMSGRGECLRLQLGVAPMAAVLVNPQAPVPPDKTARVFRALAALPVPIGVVPAGRRVAAAVFGPDVGNDLEVPASTVVPAIADVLAVLRRNTLTLTARLSGAGPTCFALTRTMADALTLAADVSTNHAGWWVRATTLG
jgi:4-diphosphocytidyl-2-C-methyl-D-erythritol kinase